ncbi:MAG TPA: metallophosphoesterase [Longimicrobiaceae bacterium]|nr:metallophosphoesterase [Longimicrobiaceae bacterium]
METPGPNSLPGPRGRSREADTRAFTRWLVTLLVAAIGSVAFAFVFLRVAPPPEAIAPAGIEPARPVPAADLVAVGDIGECPMAGARATAELARRLPGTIAVLGDEAYPTGSDADFARCFDPAWGPLKARIRPVPGNHEYLTANGAAYYRYFGPRAGRPGEGWYSYELGAWHVVAINSSVDVGPASPQVAWLRDDLARAGGRCILAYWHTPRFSVGPHGSRVRITAVWAALQQAGAAVVLSGHDHLYERFAPLTAEGRRDPVRGIRQFVVGTGGAGRYRPLTRDPNAEVVDATAWGVLHLRLEADAYAWAFVPVAGSAFTDSGRAPCHPR